MTKWKGIWRIPNGKTVWCRISVRNMWPASANGTRALSGLEWGSACILNPWYVYKRYGDSALLGRYYGNMKRYLDYLGSRTHHEVLHHGLGDWLDIGPCTSCRKRRYPSSPYLYYVGMKETAELLGKKEDAAEYEARMERGIPGI